MTRTERTLHIWRNDDAALHRAANETGIEISVMANGGVFAVEHAVPGGPRLMINQILGSPVEGGFARLYLRVGGNDPFIVQAMGPGFRGRFARADHGFVWEGETRGLRHRVLLWLHPKVSCWLWRLHVANATGEDVPCDAILAQDIGLASRGFLMGNEAYASHYIDHAIGRYGQCGPVVMSRQNMSQDGRHPWIVHGCLEGAAGFATDAAQLFGPAYRDAAEIALGFGSDLPSVRLQHEAACAIIQSKSAIAPAGGDAQWTFFAAFEPDHPEATGKADIARITAAIEAARAFPGDHPATAHHLAMEHDPNPTHALVHPARSVIQDAPPLPARALSAEVIAQLYPQRDHEEWRDGALLSFFVPDEPHNRHVALREKERQIKRRHGALLRTGQGVLPDETTMCATFWMHGVFAAQLTLGNTSLHKLFTVSRDPYNIGRANGLRILTDAGDGWRALTVPSAFEMGLNDCWWIYALDDGMITVHAIASGENAAIQWRIAVEGQPRRFLVFGQIAMGEQEYSQAGQLRIDAARKRISFRPDPDWIWAKAYPEAAFYLAVGSSVDVEAIGGDELLDTEGCGRNAPIAAFRTGAVKALSFAVVGSLTDPARADQLAQDYAEGMDEREDLAASGAFWRAITRDARITGGHPTVSGLDSLFPWLAHDAMIHLSVPHGLEQTAGAAWGTRDVCQGPVEFLLALEHDSEVKDILRIVFAQQYETRGSWPQWFMFEPYSFIQDPNSHGDVIVWPLKALCDYVECTGDLAFLDEIVPWRREDNFLKTDHGASIAAHVDKLLATAIGRFIPGAHLMRYGEGDWNDTLQPADPALREKMVSSWTAALFYQQVRRYAEILRRSGRGSEGTWLDELADGVRADFNRLLIRDGVVAGYAIFADAAIGAGPGAAAPELLLHPSDRRTGVSYSLIPMTCAILGGLFTKEQATHHMKLIREHLLFPDGARLMDKPLPYSGGVERLFRRAETSAFFGREVGQMYIHAHLRYCEAAAALGDAEALWKGLALANPISVTELLGEQASIRQRNAYFTSSDAAFPDRYEASAHWDRLKSGAVAADGGWRVYSSGPGLFVHLLLTGALGLRRRFGQRVFEPMAPASLGPIALNMVLGGQPESWST
jgi:1,2-beta-oligoglucan phosphorylase